MKQNISKLFLLLGVLFVISHCKKKTEEIIPEKIPYDCVLKSNGRCTFEYDAMGRIKEIIYHYPGNNYIENKKYTYLDKMVIVNSKELANKDTFTVQSTYYLNSRNLADSTIQRVFKNQNFSHQFKNIYQLDDSGYVVENIQFFTNNLGKTDTAYHAVNKIENGNTVFSNVFKGSEAPYTIKTEYLDSLNTIDLFEKIIFTRSTKNLYHYSKASFAWNANGSKKYVWDKFGRIIQKINISYQAHGKPPLESAPELITWDCKYY